MITLSSTDAAVAALRTAHDVSLTAYLLPPQGRVAQGLLDAAHRGAHVRVRLEGYIYKDTSGIGVQNAAVIDALRAAGADARLVHREKSDADAMLHAKTLVTDDTMFLDDRNWADDGQETVLCDTFAQDVRAGRDAAAGNEDPPSAFFSIAKRPSLAAEARLVASAQAGEDLIVESESFGANNRVYAAIDERARAGGHPRVLVNARALQDNTREADAIAQLQRDGAEVRSTSGAEKFALAGVRGWLGSANATIAFNSPDQLDWGVRTDDRAIITHLRQTFESRWQTASPIVRQAHDSTSSRRSTGSR